MKNWLKRKIGSRDSHVKRFATLRCMQFCLLYGWMVSMRVEAVASPIIALERIPPSPMNRKVSKVCTTAKSPPLAWRAEIWLCPFHVNESNGIHRLVSVDDLYCISFFFFFYISLPCRQVVFVIVCQWNRTRTVLKVTVQNFSLKIRKFHFKYIMESNENLESLIWNKIFLFVLIVIAMTI